MINYAEIILTISLTIIFHQFDHSCVTPDPRLSKDNSLQVIQPYLSDRFLVELGGNRSKALSVNVGLPHYGISLIHLVCERTIFPLLGP